MGYPDDRHLVEVGSENRQFKDESNELIDTRMQEYGFDGVPVMMLTTSETTSTGVLAVLSYAAVTSRDVTAVLAGFAEVGRHGLNKTGAEHQERQRNVRFHAECCIQFSQCDPAFRHTFRTLSCFYKLPGHPGTRRYAD